MYSVIPAKDTPRLAWLCAAYFVCYVGTGIAVKYFTEISSERISQLGFLINNTAGSVALVFVVILWQGWHRRAAPYLRSHLTWPVLVSGICTGIVIPTTTLMYLLPISIMVAMVIMRGSIIIMSRLVDAVQIRQGILKKRVTWEEDLAVIFALLAIGTNLLGASSGGFNFLHSRPALAIMAFYVTAYTIRIYVMNYYKNAAGATKLDNRIYFTIEQFWASTFMIAALGIICSWVSWQGVEVGPLFQIKLAVLHPQILPALSGIAYAGVAFFSVFIFMFRGRTATFAGVVNRLTSLLAGTTSTVLLSLSFGTKQPTGLEWASLLWIGIATTLLIKTELQSNPAAPLVENLAKSN